MIRIPFSAHQVDPHIHKKHQKPNNDFRAAQLNLNQNILSQQENKRGPERLGLRPFEEALRCKHDDTPKVPQDPCHMSEGLHKKR